MGILGRKKSDAPKLDGLSGLQEGAQRDYLADFMPAIEEGVAAIPVHGAVAFYVGFGPSALMGSDNEEALDVGEAAVKIGYATRHVELRSTGAILEKWQKAALLNLCYKTAPLFRPDSRHLRTPNSALAFAPMPTNTARTVDRLAEADYGHLPNWPSDLLLSGWPAELLRTLVSDVHLGVVKVPSSDYEPAVLTEEKTRLLFGYGYMIHVWENEVKPPGRYQDFRNEAT